jgi:hypothetical protein
MNVEQQTDEFIRLVDYMYRNFAEPSWQAVNLNGKYICFSFN